MSDGIIAALIIASGTIIATLIQFYRKKERQKKHTSNFLDLGLEKINIPIEDYNAAKVIKVVGNSLSRIARRDLNKVKMAKEKNCIFQIVTTECHQNSLRYQPLEMNQNHRTIYALI